MRASSLVAVLVVALVAATSPAAASPATGTFLQLDSQPGDPLGGGLQQTFTPADATFGAFSNGEDTFVNVYAPASGVWNIEISAPRGSGQLTPGTYTNIARSPFRAWGQPGMDVTSSAGGCNTVSGTFTIAEAVYGPYVPGNGYLRVISFDATFEVHCSDAVPALIGHVRYEDPPDTTPPTISPVSDLTTEAEDSTGTNVYYQSPYASDAIDPSPQLVCDPAYAARFPIGETTVTCTARDYSGNVSQASFKVTVLAPLEYTFTIDDLGAVDPKTGIATVGGTISCSRPGYVFVSYGDVVQSVTKRATLTGNFPGYTQFDCSSNPGRWTQTAAPSNGRFGAGKAHVDVFFAGACDQYRCFYFSKSRDITLRAKTT
jgi:HYR domain